jgi:hypothetical protein
MDRYNDYTNTVVTSANDVLQRFINYLPNLVAAVVFLIVGLVLANFLGALVHRGLQAIKIDSFANRLGLDHLSQRSGRHLSIARFGEWLVRWFIIIVTLIAVAGALNLDAIKDFLYLSVIPYFGNVIAAVIILMIGILAASFLSDLVKGALSASQVVSANALSAVTRWAIIVFSVIAALAQLKIAEAFLQDLFRAIVVMLALAGGLAFGLGGRDHAKKILDKIESDLTRK